MKTVNPVGWFDIYVADLARAKAFYETVFAIELKDFPEEWGKQAAFPADYEGLNISGALVEKEDWTPGHSNTLVYFVSDDCLTEEARVVAAGGQVLQPKTAIGEFGFISMLQDTEGNTIGLHSRS